MDKLINLRVVHESEADKLDNAIHHMLCDVAQAPLHWNIETIGEIRDVIQSKMPFILEDHFAKHQSLVY